LDIPADDCGLGGYVSCRRTGAGASSVVVEIPKAGISHAVGICHLKWCRANFMRRSNRDPREETQIVQRFSHPHAVRVFDFVEDAERRRIFIVTEALAGGAITNCAGLAAQREAFHQVLEAAHRIHGARVAHRDIRTDDLTRRAGGTTLLVDFWIGLLVPEDCARPAQMAGAPEPNAARVRPAHGGRLGPRRRAPLRRVRGGHIRRAERVRARGGRRERGPDDAAPEVVDVIAKMLNKGPVTRTSLRAVQAHLFFRN